MANFDLAQWRQEWIEECRKMTDSELLGAWARECRGVCGVGAKMVYMGRLRAEILSRGLDLSVTKKGIGGDTGKS